MKTREKAQGQNLGERDIWQQDARQCIVYEAALEAISKEGVDQDKTNCERLMAQILVIRWEWKLIEGFGEIKDHITPNSVIGDRYDIKERR